MTDPTGNRRWFVLVIIILGTFMAILDSSIVNVALPHMMSAFGVNRDQIEWVVTGFMLATAVAMPLVGFFVNRFGHKALYVTSLAMFTAGSGLCALAWSYHALLVARIIQAVGGGAIQPVGMAIIADLFAPGERGRALGIWGTGVMIAPALGPTLGGYLTDWYSWRSIFSVNLPVGIITLFLAVTMMKSGDAADRRRRPFDWWGFVFLSLALVTGLLALSEGQEQGWGSAIIRTYLALTVVGTVMFLAIEQSTDHPLLDLRLFRYRNYTLSMVLAVFRSVGLFGGVFLLPIFLENLVGYTTIRTGLWMMPGAVAVGVMMPISGRMADRFHPAGLVAAGTVITGLSLFLYGNLDPRSGALMIIGPQLVRGVGLALMMTPLLTAAINAVPRDQVATASSFINVAQRLGGSFGIAVLNTFVTSRVQVHAVHLGSLMPPQSPAFARFAAHVAGAAGAQGHGALPPALAGGALAATTRIMHQAQVLAFDNAFMVAGVIVLAGLPLALLLKREVQPPRAAPPPTGEARP